MFFLILILAVVSCKPKKPPKPTLEFRLKGPYSVSGRLSVNDEPLANMFVSFKYRWGKSMYDSAECPTRTDESGFFLIPDLPAIAGSLYWYRSDCDRIIQRTLNVTTPICLTNNCVQTSIINATINLVNEREYENREVVLFMIDPNRTDADFSGSYWEHLFQEFEFVDKEYLIAPDFCFCQLPKGTYVITCNSKVVGREKKWFPALFKPQVVNLKEGEYKNIIINDIPYFERINKERLKYEGDGNTQGNQ